MTPQPLIEGPLITLHLGTVANYTCLATSSFLTATAQQQAS